MVIERFKQLYHIVFDDAGYVKLCGRENCKELITLVNQIAPDVDHGNAITGIMHEQSIRDLYSKLNQI